jgi:multidrug efflux pump subunit AcrA (membrane-fusion protein)
MKIIRTQQWYDGRVLPLACMGLLLTAIAQGAEPIRIERAMIRLIEEVDVPAREGGALETLLVKEGDAVTAGAPLARLDTELQDLAVRHAEVELQVARHKAANHLPVDLAAKMLEVQEQAALEHEVKRKIAHQRAENDSKAQSTRRKMEVSRNELDRAIRARSDFAESISDSEMDLRKLNADQAQFDYIQAALEHKIDGMLAEAEDLAQASAALTIEHARLEKELAEDQLVVDGLDVSLKENQLAKSQAELSRRTIVAPIGGIVVELRRHAGEWVRPGDSLLRMIRLDRLRAEGFVTSAQALQLKRGAKVVILVEEVPGDPITREGVITFVSPEVDPVNNETRIWAEFDNANLALRPGMHGMIEIALPANAATAASAR